MKIKWIVAIKPRNKRLLYFYVIYIYNILVIWFIYSFFCVTTRYLHPKHNEVRPHPKGSSWLAKIHNKKKNNARVCKNLMSLDYISSGSFFVWVKTISNFGSNEWAIVIRKRTSSRCWHLTGPSWKHEFNKAYISEFFIYAMGSKQRGSGDNGNSIRKQQDGQSKWSFIL